MEEEALNHTPADNPVNTESSDFTIEISAMGPEFIPIRYEEDPELFDLPSFGNTLEIFSSYKSEFLKKLGPESIPTFHSLDSDIDSREKRLEGYLWLRRSGFISKLGPAVVFFGQVSSRPPVRFCIFLCKYKVCV